MTGHPRSLTDPRPRSGSTGHGLGSSGARRYAEVGYAPSDVQASDGGRDPLSGSDPIRPRIVRGTGFIMPDWTFFQPARPSGGEIRRQDQWFQFVILTRLPPIHDANPHPVSHLAYPAGAPRLSPIESCRAGVVFWEIAAPASFCGRSSRPGLHVCGFDGTANFPSRPGIRSPVMWQAMRAGR